jgi:SAM-dependent methyltransferase
VSDPRRARSFDAVAAEYERYRPEYPAAALRWVADRLGVGTGARVLDVGAGTGKLTRGLLSLGLDVVAVDPGPPMLAQLRAATPAVEAYEGSAEAVPLPDGSVDAAVAGQAYHWFDPGLALPELHRVLRPRGGLAVLWNWWDVRDPLQARLGELLEFEPEGRFEPLPGLPFFSELDRAVIESAPETTPESLGARLATTSRLITAEAAERRELLAAVHRLAAERGERFPLPQLTYVFAFRRVS